ncbi:MAG: hypothetical protein GC166_03745 [Alphaproteobacteria bacterium]|nr:hypothetical protein [Alphaproteobacteria bacterium]
MSDPHNEHNATLREWRVALITIGVVLVIALGVAVYFALKVPKLEPIPEQPVDQPQQSQQPSPENEAANKAALQEVCKTALKGATDYGILPGYTKLASTAPAATKMQGRYTCVGTTDAAQYAVVFDLLCNDIANEKCVMLMGVQADDGNVLFARAVPKTDAKDSTNDGKTKEEDAPKEQ